MGLNKSHEALLRSWLPDVRVFRDHGWGLGESTVLEVSSEGRSYIVKAGGDGDVSIAREVHAHLHWLAPWVSQGNAPRLVHYDLAAHLLVTTFLPGELVLGHEAMHLPGTFAQAGRLLAEFHGQLTVTSPDYESRENARSLAWLDGEHRISRQKELVLREMVRSWPTPPTALVPTHGDWQPRNWLIDGATVKVIDFGRAALRPASADLARLSVQDFKRDARLGKAFFEGYGPDPRDSEQWGRQLVRDAIGTACWAYVNADEAFEAQGHAMIAAVTPV